MDSTDVHVNDDIGENNDPDKGYFYSFYTMYNNCIDVYVNDDIGENNDPDKGPHPETHSGIFKQQVQR
jgi:hypothetical protein